MWLPKVIQPGTESRSVTVRELARQLNISPMTVSRALRDHPEVSVETRRRVQEQAEKVGYRADPLVGAVMRRMRVRQGRRDSETLAVVWPHALLKGDRSNPRRMRFMKGILDRAEQFGFAVQEWERDPQKMSDARMSQIFFHRGIRSVLLLPAYPYPSINIGLEWDRFAVATVGHGPMNEVVHRSVHDHYGAMEMAVENLLSRGCRKLGAVLPREWDDFVHHRYSAAFFTLSGRPRSAIFRGDFPSSEFVAWLKLGGYDALICPCILPEAERKACGLKGKSAPLLVSLHWMPDDAPYAGVDQMPERVSAAAMDLILGQLTRYEHGIPEYPKTVLVPGVWRHESRN